LRTLIQTRLGTVHSLGNDALSTGPARKGEHDRPIFGDVFVEQDAGLSIAQQPRQSCFTLEKRAIAEILAIMLDQVEGVGIFGVSGRRPGRSRRYLAVLMNSMI
jgi:hypothetical protein